MSDERCETCRFYGQFNEMMGNCHRFPKPEKVSYGYGCGEWKPEGEKAPEQPIDVSVDVEAQKRPRPGFAQAKLAFITYRPTTYCNVPLEEFNKEELMKMLSCYCRGHDSCLPPIINPF